jgi:hypothetical protein
MKIEIHQLNNTSIAEVISDTILIKNPQDGLDLLADVYYQDIDKMILYEKNITPDFFSLKTGIAGEMLQKFSNYRVRLAIVGDFSNYSGKSITDFIFESNKMGQINFVSSLNEAKEKLARR